MLFEGLLKILFDYLFRLPYFNRIHLKEVISHWVYRKPLKQASSHPCRLGYCVENLCRVNGYLPTLMSHLHVFESNLKGPMPLDRVFVDVA